MTENASPAAAPANPHRIGFALSTKERIEFTSRILPGLDCGGFDLIWCDGSKTSEGRAFASAKHFSQTPLKEIHHDVTGGPDAAIQFSLKRLLALGYDYVGLIENDIQLKPGWLQAMMSAWQAAEREGFKVGAATARSMASRVLAYGPEFVVKWNVGAGMVLFSRAAAEAVLADYSVPSALEIRDFFRQRAGVDLAPAWELFMDKKDRLLGADWRYASSVWKQNLVSIGTVPTFAENIDMDIRRDCQTDYVHADEAAWPCYCLTTSQLKTALALAGQNPVPAVKAEPAPPASCPVCRTVAATAESRPLYHRCPSCQCVFMPSPEAGRLLTEINRAENPEQNVIRLQRLTQALGRPPETVLDFGGGDADMARCLQAHGVNTVAIGQAMPMQFKDVPDGSVAGIMLVEVIQHLFEPHEVFQQFRRVLKPGGVVYLESSFADEKNLAFWNYLDHTIGHCTVHTVRSLSLLAEQNGFATSWVNRNVCLITKRVSPVPDDSDALPTGEGIGEGIANPLVTVVVSVRQSGELLEPCLENLSRQTIFDRCEIIIMDSGSSESVRAVVAEFQAKFPNIRCIRTPHETTDAAWNRGLELARGRFWASVNLKDSLRSDTLEIFAAALDKHADCALAYADCAWTTQPNDMFPSANIIKSVKYPHYTPLETVFYSLTGGGQFFRTESLRQLGGFDATLDYAGDYDANVKLMLAGLNAVHVPEPLSLIFKHAIELTAPNERAVAEHRMVQQRCRENLGIGQIFQVEPGNLPAAADALAMLGVRAIKFPVPGEDRPVEDLEFAVACFEAALSLDPENLAAGTHLIALHYRLKQLEQAQAELISRWPKMAEWIKLFYLGEGSHQPPMKHARLGPVYRPADWAHRPAKEQLIREPEALQPWITRIDGRHVYLSEDFFPRPAGLHYTREELQTTGKRMVEMLMSLPPFYAHLGGAGDALLLLAAFYDRHPDGIIFSHPNSVGATRALFDAFPKLSKIYFLPQHSEPFFHITLRYLVCTLRNCLGAGTTPKDNYDEEWKAGLDIAKKYRISKSPRWAAAFRQNTDSRKVAVAPKGSLTGMVGSKRNIIAPENWPLVLAHIQERGFEPVILGTPSEAREYPALPGCTDARAENFSGQMKLIGQCAGLVGADSWAKSFSALAEIPTLVFEPLKSADLAAWKDSSDWVFIEPWPSIKMIRSLEEFRRAFDARIAKIPGAEPQKKSKPVIAWEGSFLDYGSLSHINRELSSRIASSFDVTCVGPNVLSGRAQADPAMQRCAKKLAARASVETAVTVRHQWPPNWSKPASGSLVVIQPWEYGALPKAWVANEKNVDEFWVPSPIVRAMYVDSGIAPEKVRVVPNGVDTKKFRPGVRPLALKTKKKFKFLFVGGTIFRKGPDILLAAFTQAFTAADDVCLIVKDFGGDSCYQGQTAGDAIRAIQQKPGSPEILHLTDELSAEQMPSLYAACDCFVLPYRGEGFGMPVLEAMACGLPVIVTAGGATDSFVAADAGWKIPSRGIRLSDHVGEIPLVKNGWMLEPSTPHLVTILKLAASRPDECRQRGANGRASAEKRFDWSDIAASVKHRLKELAERAPAPIAAGKADLWASQIVKPIAKADQQVSPTKIVLPAVARVGQLDEAREIFAQKEYPAAWQAVLTAIAQRPFHPEAFLLLAEIALAAGDTSRAKLCAQRARNFAPGLKAAKEFLRKPFKGGAAVSWATLPGKIDTRLSVCLIVKNEEHFLAQCLNSVRGLASQIIVVDTGSTDRTVEIAREFGAEIYAFKWTDDFAAARNAALEHATGDWVLILDADEELPVAQHERLRADMKQADAIAFRLPLVNRGQEAEGRSFVPRLFRNAPGNHYFGRIHEQIFSSLLPKCTAWGLKTSLGTAEILHHGYTKEMVRDRNKIERNLKLLPQAIAENPTDVNLVMNLGLELVRSGDLSGGVTQYRDAFELMSAQPAGEVVVELREVLLTQFTSQLYKIRAHAEVVQVLNSPLARNGGLTASLHFALGLAHFELKDYRAAADQMRQCLAKRKQPALSPINTDILTAAPNHCLALSLAKLGEVDAAEKAFQAALGEPGRVDDVKLDRAKFLLNQNRAVDALNALHEIVAANPGHLVAWRLGGDIALSQPEFLEFARDWTGEAMKSQAEDLGVTAQHAEALMLSGDTAAAGDLWERVWNSDRQPKSLAALILCEAVEAPTTHAPDEGPEELVTSRAFIAWYQKLIASRAQPVIGKVNEASDKLSRALPTAAKLLETALAETEACDTV
jgi:glycosyltransferase involved in cell wall biosynthesis/Tfp pilus assembly protein PilF